MTNPFPIGEQIHLLTPDDLAKLTVENNKFYYNDNGKKIKADGSLLTLYCLYEQK